MFSIKCRVNWICNLNKYQPVCGSNRETYENICFLEKAACKDRTIKWVKMGKCGNLNFTNVVLPDVD